MDVLTFLEQQHKEAKAMFKRLEQAKGAEAAKVFGELRDALTMHETLEEKFMYPRLKDDKRAHDIILESYQEHHVMDLLKDEISQLSPSNEAWPAKIQVLSENTEHHVQEEEEDLFPKVRKIWDSETRTEVGNQMEAFMKTAKAKVA